MTRVLNFLALLAAAAVAGCATASSHRDRIQLTATLLSPHDIELKWTDPVPGAAGYTIEWTPDEQSEYVVVAFLPPYTNSFIHPDLMPLTTCHYRVRAFYGPASTPVEVSLPSALSDTEYAARYEAPEDFNWAVPQVVPGEGTVSKHSIRNPATPTDGTPADLKAELMPITVSGFKLTWTDHASDEEGYMLEMKRDAAPDFEVKALTEPDVNSFGYAFEPPMRHASYRVRAFYFSKPSNMVRRTTGPEAAPH